MAQTRRDPVDGEVNATPRFVVTILRTIAVAKTID
jgi:hypothetical protein